MKRRESELHPGPNNQTFERPAIQIADFLQPRRRIISFVLLVLLIATLSPVLFAQNEVPFEVSNNKHKAWPVAVASKIYFSACQLVAREIRPERPPQLHPKFVLVLGADSDQVVTRNREVSEIRLKSWNPQAFSQGVVFLAAQEVLKEDQMSYLARHAVSDAEATISVAELAEKQ